MQNYQNHFHTIFKFNMIKETSWFIKDYSFLIGPQFWPELCAIISYSISMNVEISSVKNRNSNQLRLQRLLQRSLWRKMIGIWFQTQCSNVDIEVGLFVFLSKFSNINGFSVCLYADLSIVDGRRIIIKNIIAKFYIFFFSFEKCENVVKSVLICFHTSRLHFQKCVKQWASVNFNRSIVFILQCIMVQYSLQFCVLCEREHRHGHGHGYGCVHIYMCMHTIDRARRSNRIAGRVRTCRNKYMRNMWP